MSKQPVNINFLSPVGFQLNFYHMPEVTYFVQDCNLPGINLNSQLQPNPFVDINWYSDKVTFNDLNISFKVDEDLTNYLEIWKWMVGLGFPKNFDQFKSLANLNSQIRKDIGSTLKDATLTILTNKHRPNVRIIFKDIFPVSLSDLNFTTTAQNIDFITCTASFRYMLYDIEVLLDCPAS